jgi:hypothetical protein
MEERDDRIRLHMVVLDLYQKSGLLGNRSGAGAD